MTAATLATLATPAARVVLTLAAFLAFLIAWRLAAGWVYRHRTRPLVTHLDGIRAHMAHEDPDEDETEERR